MKMKYALIAIMICLLLCGCASTDYKIAQEKIANGEYEEAVTLLTELGDYKDSLTLLKDTQTKLNYSKANDFLAAGNYSEAYAVFSSIAEYGDSQEKLSEIEKKIKEEIISSFVNMCTELKQLYSNDASAIEVILTTDDYLRTYPELHSALANASKIAEEAENIISISSNFPFAQDVKKTCEEVVDMYTDISNFPLSFSLSSCRVCFDAVVRGHDHSDSDSVFYDNLVPIIIGWNDSLKGKTTNIPSYSNGLIPYYSSIIDALK